MRLIFIASSLERGGLQHEVEATARLALNVNHEVKLFTPYKVRDDSVIKRNLQRLVPFDSGQEHWRRSFQGRALLQGARLKHLVTGGRPPLPAEEVHLARRFVPAQEAGFWDDQARRMLTGGDLLHLFGKPKPFLARAARLARSAGLKVIYEEASQVTPEYANRHDHRHFAVDSEWCDVIIARCERHVESIRTHYRYHGATRVIEQWAYDAEDDLLAIPRPAPAGASGPFIFGTVARLDEGKGIDTILHAFARVRRERPGVRLRVGGRGGSEGTLRKLAAELELDSDAEFIGYLEGAEKTAFYASLDAFVLASSDEGGPITGVEAMAAGLAILSTPVGAMPERLKDGSEALFFEPGGADGLAAAMIRLLTDEELARRLGDAARRRYGQRNHSRVCALQKTALWNELGERQR